MSVVAGLAGVASFVLPILAVALLAVLDRHPDREVER